MQTRMQFLSGLSPLTELPADIDNECSVCTDEFVGPVQLPCKHVFCKACIVEWLSRRNRNTCPTCRHAFFSLNETDRGLIGADRQHVLAQALENSRLTAPGEFDVYSSDVEFRNSAVQRAAAAAYQYLSEEQHSTSFGSALINVRDLEPHVLAMGNLLRGYARAAGRPYSGYQRRDWKLIICQLLTSLSSSDGAMMDGDSVLNMAQRYRNRIGQGLRTEGIDTYSGRFFEVDGRVESPSGDLHVLLDYVVYQCREAFELREERRLARREAQQLALDRQTTTAGRALRRLGQNLFGMI